MANLAEIVVANFLRYLRARVDANFNYFIVDQTRWGRCGEPVALKALWTDWSYWTDDTGSTGPSAASREIYGSTEKAFFNY
jgi:hypothetical protein